MDDLNGLSWSSSSPNDTRKPPPMNSGLLFPTVRRNDASGRSSPFSSTGQSNPSSKPATPDKDSFANLVSFNSSSSNKNLSLLEQQKKLQEERARKEAENKARFDNSQFWDSLEGGASSRSTGSGALPVQLGAHSNNDDEDDILAAFNASAPVDASTNFPVPSPSPSPQIQITSTQYASSNGPGSSAQGTGTGTGMLFDDDDDTFGLNQLKPKSQSVGQHSQADDDDDFLGLLGKPVSEIPKPKPPKQSPIPSERQAHSPSPKPMSGVDRAIAELVDMGFPADKASQALGMTTSGTDVQAAVGLLLTQAHEESRQKSRNQPIPSDRHSSQSDRSRNGSQRPDRDTPSWMQQERPQPARSRSDNRTPSSAEKDPAQVAVTFGNNLLKTANSLWKTGSKKVQQAVNDFNNADHDPSQPKWMREAAAREESSRREQPQRGRETLTDEALLLESGAASRPSRNPIREREEPPLRPGSNFRQPQMSTVDEGRMQQPPLMRHQQPTLELRDNSRTRVSKLAVEEQSAQAYVSPARRKRPTAPSPIPSESIDLFDSSAPPKPVQKPTPPPPANRPSRSSTPNKSLPARPKAAPRVIPQVSQQALASTHSHREKAAAAYKRGDYAAAHDAFSAALTGLPEKHPIVIILRSNRAMTALKIGEPKVAISDADMILDLIGPSKGEGESIDLRNGEAHKPMKDFFGKALMRKAEGLEQLERWVDAAQSWKLAVENGHGGSTSIQGRNRCEKAAGISKPPPKPSNSKPSPPTRRTPAPQAKKSSALEDLQGGPSASSKASSDAVDRLRAANQEAARADDEKFALTDSVDARLAAWKNGKQDNLRALLASLDTVLWSGSGWKKINMSELIMPSKVKVQYMKGIAKVHPDKIPTDATTEQRMIAGAVFGTLNEAWDKFKTENNL